MAALHDKSCTFKMSRQDWNLLVLAASGGSPLQPVQLQKALFLLGQKATAWVGPTFYTFEPYDYGPFDKEIYWDVDRLVADGFAYVQSGRMKVFGATAKGVNRAEELGTKIPEMWTYVKQLVAWVRSLSFNDLVRAIYAEYPEYRAKSVFQG